MGATIDGVSVLSPTLVPIGDATTPSELLQREQLPDDRRVADDSRALSIRYG
jgi:hypothetical protein